MRQPSRRRRAGVRGVLPPAFGLAPPDFPLAVAVFGLAAAGLGFLGAAFAFARGRFGGGERRRVAISLPGAG